MSDTKGHPYREPAPPPAPVAKPPQRCPRCGTINPSSAIWCDCGFDFRTGESGRGARPRSIPGTLRIRIGAVVFCGFGIVGLVLEATGKRGGPLFGLAGTGLMLLIQGLFVRDSWQRAQRSPSRDESSW